MKRGFLFLLMAIAFSMLAPAVSLASYFVESVRGDAGNISIKRQGRKIPVAILTRLQSGDVIHVAGPGTALTITANGRKTLIVDQQNSPFVVPKEPKASGLLRNLLAIASDWIAGEEERDVNTITRGAKNAPLRITSIHYRVNYLLQGTGTIYVDWKGGAEPFSVQMSKAKERRNLFEQAEIYSRGVKITGLRLDRGRYRVLVSALGEDGVSSDSFGFKVVSREKLPRQARMLLDEEMPKKLKWRLLAAVLASHGPWRFTAWQIAREHDLVAIRTLLEKEIYPEKAGD